MELATKQKVIAASVIALIVITVGVPGYKHQRAVQRLKEIVNNLKLIDNGRDQYCMESSINAHGRVVTRADLTECPTGMQSYVAWPEGPISGTYSTTTCDGPSTFDAGTLGPLNRKQWLSMCSADPSGCGL